MANNIYEIIIDKSKFIGIIISDFHDINDVKNIVKLNTVNYKKPSHICWAYSTTINNINYKKYNNDGEPKGSAGPAILSSIENNKMDNTLVIVVRYFGGKKLGVSKLLRIYRKTANKVIKLSDEK